MRTFNTYIKKFNSESSISQEALVELNEICVVMADRISALTKERTLMEGKKTMNADHVYAVLQMFHYENLVASAVSRGKRAIELYNSDEKAPDGSRMEVRAGLTISVSLCRSYLEKHKGAGMRISETTPIAVAAALEVVIRDLRNMSANAARDNRLVIVKPRHVMLAIRNDPELLPFLKVLGYEQRTGGVVPRVHGALVPKQKRSKTTREPNPATGKVPHRFRPGTVSLRNINRYQKSDSIVVAKATSRALIDEYRTDSVTRISKEAHAAVHYFLESELVSLFTDTVRLTIHAGRTSSTAEDVKLAASLRFGESFPDIEMSSEKKMLLKKPEIERASFRGGIKTRSSDFFAASDAIIQRIVGEFVKSAVASAAASERATLLAEDFQAVLKANGVPHGAR